MPLFEKSIQNNYMCLQYRIWIGIDVKYSFIFVLEYFTKIFDIVKNINVNRKSKSHLQASILRL